VSTAHRRDRPESCELCGRQAHLSFHHLIPKKNHRKRRYRKRYETEELKQRGLWLCRLCHRQIHRFFSEDELGTRLNTREALLEDPQMARFLQWARKQKRR
jgi:rubrerythrin